MALVNKVGMVVHPVADLDQAQKFYEEILGLKLKFRDGERFCAFDVNGVTIALAAHEERLTTAPAVSYKVDDAQTALATLTAAGAKPLSDLMEGPHEHRAVLADPAGNPFVIYSSK